MENSRKFNGIWLPKELWLAKDLGAIDKVILAEIDSLDNENHCTASNEYFAKFCQCSERTVSRSITKLIELGYISMVSFNGRVRKLKSNCLFRVDKMSDETRQNVWADQTKCPANNINNNIDNNITNIEKIYNKKELSLEATKTNISKENLGAPIREDIGKKEIKRRINPLPPDKKSRGLNDRNWVDYLDIRSTEGPPVEGEIF